MKYSKTYLSTKIKSSNFKDFADKEINFPEESDGMLLGLLNQS